MREELRGKTIIFDGDSICHATSETQAPERGWAYRIGAANEMDWHNIGISGATVTAEMYSRVTGNVMIPRTLGTAILLTSFPGFGFSISPLILSKIPKILGILFINKTRMEKNRQKTE